MMEAIAAIGAVDVGFVDTLFAAPTELVDLFPAVSTVFPFVPQNLEVAGQAAGASTADRVQPVVP